MSALHELTLTEMARRIRSGELTSLELTENLLGRIERHAGALNAFISPDPDGARAAARAADAAQARGEPLGLLHGVPLAHKDMFYRVGHVATCGSVIRRNYVPEVTEDLEV